MAKLFLLGLSILLIIVGAILLFLLALALGGVISIDPSNLGQKTVAIIALGGGFIIAGIVIFQLARVRDRLDTMMAGR